MCAQTQQIHGFHFATEKLSGNRSMWEYFAANPSAAASVCVPQETVRENLIICDHYEGKQYGRTVSQQIIAFEFNDLKWHYTKNTAIPKGTLVQIDSCDIAALIDQQIANFETKKEATQVEVNLGDGLVIRGDIFRVSPFRTKGSAHILPLAYAEIEYRPLSSGDGKDFYFQGSLKHPEAKRPLTFHLITEVRFDQALVERKTEVYSPVFKRNPRVESPAAFLSFTVKEPIREFLLPATR